ncbi:hypothetical protein COF73_29235 [Bacillus toyonensis]|nr:hypothetical protein COF73_29235 [Bacillus toyonensis]
MGDQGQMQLHISCIVAAATIQEIFRLEHLHFSFAPTGAKEKFRLRQLVFSSCLWLVTFVFVFETWFEHKYKYTIRQLKKLAYNHKSNMNRHNIILYYTVKRVTALPSLRMLRMFFVSRNQRDIGLAI